MTDLARLEALEKQRTPGEWRCQKRQDAVDQVMVWITGPRGEYIALLTSWAGVLPHEVNGEYIVAAVNALPTLIERAKRADAAEAAREPLKDNAGQAVAEVVRAAMRFADACRLSPAGGKNEEQFHDAKDAFYAAVDAYRAAEGGQDAG